MMDDLDFTSARLVEEIQQGLRSLDEEEGNLLMLKGQLTKVKRFREEQARKDDIIKALRDRVASLEYEREFSRKQSAELEEIMADRISALERSLAERDETEKEFAAYQVQAEMVEMERDSLKADLEAEKKSHDQARMEISELTNQIHRLHEALQNERQVGVNSAALFDALRAELQLKERQISDQAKKNKESVAQLSHALSVSRKATEDMAGKLLRLEEDKSALEVHVHRLTGLLNEARHEAAANGAEVKRWSDMYTELEKVLSTVKAESIMAQQSHSREVTNLQSELAQRTSELDAAKLELSAQLSSLTSIAGDMATITATKPPTSLNQLHHHRTEVLATVRSLKRFVSKLSEPSLVTELYKKMVTFAEEVTVRMLSYHEGLLEWSQSSSEESKRAMGLEQSSSGLQRDLGYADAAVEKLIGMFQAAGFLYTVGTAELKAANMGAVKAESLGSEYRARLYEEVQLGAAAALRKLGELSTEVEEWKKRDTAHCEELRSCVEATRAMKERYSAEVEHLHRMNEEALVAVRVAEYESGTEVNRLKEEYRTRFQQETREVQEKVAELQESVAVMSGKYRQTTACLEKMVRHSTEQQERFARLGAAYRILKGLYGSAERVATGVHSLAQCCRPRPNTYISSGALHGKHTKPEAMMFEPFLDPLEEVPMRTRKVTLRVAALYVLAAVRLSSLLRAHRGRVSAAQRRRSSPSRTGGAAISSAEVDFPLPPLYELQDKSPGQVASMLRDALRQHHSEHMYGPGAPRFRPHQDMTMEEFDAYLCHYGERNGGNGGGKERSLLQRLSSAAPAQAFLRGIYQMHNVGVLYRTLSDMSAAAEADRSELQQVKNILTSLEDKVRTQERVIAQQDNALRAAQDMERQLREQLAQVERERRSKSWHLLNEIHQELRQDATKAEATRVASRYVPERSSYEGGRFYSGRTEASSFTNDSFAQDRSAESHPPADMSTMSVPVPAPSTPAPEPAPFTETPIAKRSGNGSPPATVDLLSATPTHGLLHRSFEDTYRYNPDTPSVLHDAPDFNSSAVLNASQVDWDFGTGGSFHSHYSGTDTAIHPQAHLFGDSGAERGDYDSTWPRRSVDSGRPHEDWAADMAVKGAAATNAPHTTRSALISRSVDFVSSRTAATTTASAATTRTLPLHHAGQSPGRTRPDPKREQHESAVSTMYTDIGRLAGRLETRLRKDSAGTAASVGLNDSGISAASEVTHARHAHFERK